MNLKDKVAIVTGGTRDIGKAVSLKLAAAGANVVVNYCHNKAQGDETVKEITDAGGTAIAVAGDMTKARWSQRSKNARQNSGSCTQPLASARRGSFSVQVRRF